MLKSFLITVHTLIFDPGMLFRHYGPKRRRFYEAMMNVLKFGEIYRRKKMLRGLHAEPLGRIEKDMGYLIVSQTEGNFGDLVEEAISEVRALRDKGAVHTEVGGGKDYLLKLLPRDQVSSGSALYRLATSPEMLKTAGDYLGMLPVCTYLNVWFSPNEASAEMAGSQFMHLDHEAWSQLKVFLFADDVDRDTGPFLAVSAQDSSEIQAAIGYSPSASDKRLEDSVFSNVNIIPFTGKAGAIAFVDTSRCFHAGSREGTKTRLVAVFQYLTPTAYVAKAYQGRLLNHLVEAGTSELERKVLQFG